MHACSGGMHHACGTGSALSCTASYDINYYSGISCYRVFTFTTEQSDIRRVFILCSLVAKPAAVGHSKERKTISAAQRISFSLLLHTLTRCSSCAAACAEPAHPRGHVL